MANPREALESHVFETMLGVTRASGYDLPRDFKVITREILDFPETVGKRPALILAWLDCDTEDLELGGVVWMLLHGVIGLHIDPENGQLPATQVNRYKGAVREALVRDRSRGGQAISTRIIQEPTPAIWIKTTPFIVEVHFRIESIPFLEEAVA